MDSFKITMKRDSCDIALQWLKEKAVIDAEGKRTLNLNLESNRDYLYSMAVDEILVWSTTIQPLIPEFSKVHVVNKAIDRWLRYRKYRNNLDKVCAFEEALSIELKILSQDEEYRLVAFINLHPENYLLQRPIEVSGITVEFTPWSSLNSINFMDLWDEAKAYLPKHIAEIFNNTALMAATFIPVIITIHSFSKDDALRLAQKKFNLLRVALNFTSATSILIKYGEAFPLSKFVESPVWYVMGPNNSLSFAAYTTTDIQLLQTETASKDEYNKVLNIIARINESRGLWKLITNLLYLYQEALDLSESREVYLALWRLLEAAILDDPKHPINISALVGRFSELEKDPILKQSLDMLSFYRNDLVHDGTFPGRTNDIVFLLKNVVDTTLVRMIQLTKDINDENELRDYLALLSTNNTDLTRKAKVIGLLQSGREKKAG